MTPTCSIPGCPLQRLMGTGHEDGGHRPPVQVGLGRGSQALQTLFIEQLGQRLPEKP